MTAPSFRFQLALSMMDRSGDVSVNDVPVFRNYDGTRVDTALPVTEWMVQGENRLRWDLFTDDEAALGTEVRARATLRAQPAAGGEWRDIMPLAVVGPILPTPPAPAAPADSPLGALSASDFAADPRTRIAKVGRAIRLSAAMPRWAWTLGPKITDDAPTLESLKGYYRGLHRALATGDVAAVGGAMREKVQELAIAYRVTEADMAAEIGLLAMPGNAEWTLSTPAWDRLEIELAGDGRLVRLFDPEAGTVIVYRHRTDLYGSFDFWLRRGPGGWIMTR